MSSRKGELRVNVVSARGLRDTAIFGIQDPYVQVSTVAVSLVTPNCSGTQANAETNALTQLVHGSLKVKTAVHRDGGTSPVWNESIKL